ncbi:MAG: LacI family transcriptional regulator [Alteromonadaceae bacterium]|nr:MAG: LacI family transcriptional regulator [Alteromonadaceae bacterium]
MSNIGIKELAKIAGVSIATASRAISNPGRVSQATREKVLAAAKNVGYTPNRLGSGLRTSKTGNIIAIIPDVSDTFNFGVIKSLERAASKHGYSVLLGDTQGLRERELAYGEMVKSKQADGIILFSHRLPFEHDTDKLGELKLPPMVNSCESTGDGEIPLVSIDNTLAAREATQHLIEFGHKDIAVITGDINTPSSKARLAGYYEALNTASIEVDPQYIVTGEYSIESGQHYAEQLLLLKHRPSAIFCFSDEIAFGCLHTLRAHGFDVPNDVSVIGFDDIRFAKYVSPSLTTVAQPAEAIGEHCVNLLISQINKSDIKPESVVLPHQLIIRESTAPYSP